MMVACEDGIQLTVLKLTCWKEPRMLTPQGPCGLTLSSLGLDLDLMASGLGLIEIGLVASNIYSAHDIN